MTFLFVDLTDGLDVINSWELSGAWIFVDIFSNNKVLRYHIVMNYFCVLNISIIMLKEKY